MKLREKVPITLKIAIISIAIIIVVLTLYTCIQLVFYSFFNVYYQREEIMERYYEIQNIIESESIKNTEEAISLFFRDLDLEMGEYVSLYDHDKVIYKSPTNVWDSIDKAEKEEFIKIEYINNSKFIILNKQIEINDKTYTMQVVQNLRAPKQFIKRYAPIIFLSVSTGLILSVMGAMYVLKAVTNRLRKLSNTMEKVKKEGLHERVQISSANDAFDEVSIMFNSMMDELEEAFEEQKRFVSDASHELRTPLTALRGHLGMIKRWGKNDKERLEKSLDICLSEVDRLTKITNDLLELSRLEKSSINIGEIEEIYPKEVFEEIIQHYKILNSKSKISFQIDNNIMLNIKEDHLKQILIIFIDNAIKYNDKEDIEINIKLEMKNDKKILSVRDNGIGIPEEDIDKITSRFYKVDKSRKNNSKSFGLGLSIADRIIKNYEGKLKIESKVGIFTKIIVEFLE